MSGRPSARGAGAFPPPSANFDSGSPLPPLPRRRRRRRPRRSSNPASPCSANLAAGRTSGAAEITSTASASGTSTSSSRSSKSSPGVSFASSATVWAAAKRSFDSFVGSPVSSSTSCGTRDFCRSRLVIGVFSYSSSDSSKKSETYRNASRSRPIFTKADCIPGSTRVTRPLWILPASEYSSARWK